MGTLKVGMRSGALALAAALFLAPGAARATNDCGALNTGNMFTENCPDAAYTGIVYWDQPNAVTLTVPGTATTATVTAGANNGLHNGITIRTNDDTTSPRTSAVRNIRLTVGGAGTFVAIEQSGTRASSWYNNRGIVVFQRDGDGATTTLDIKSGVTIGTSTDKMESRGIEVRTYESDAGAVTVTNAAAIHSEDGGIHVENPGAGAVTLTNSGAIATDDRGIYVHDSGSAGAVTVANSGAITSESTGNDEGIFAKTIGKDSAGDNAGVSITHSAGAIAVADGGIGIKVHVGTARSEDDVGGAGYQAPMNAGLAKVSVTGGSVSAKGGAIQATNYEAGSVKIDTSAGVTLTSTHGHGIHAELTDVGNTEGTVTVTNAATIAAGTTTMASGHGIFVKRPSGSGAVTVTNSGTITASGYGIFSMATGTVSVTHSAGDIEAETESGIYARNSAGNADAVTVAVTGGSVKSDGQSKPAVQVLQLGTGDAVARVSSGATLTSKHNAGIYANLDHAANAAGQVKITSGGTIAGRKGVYARAGRASVVTIAAGTTTSETRAAAAQPLIDVTWSGSFSHGTSVTVAQDDDDRFVASTAARAIAIAQEVETEKAIRYGSPAGIEAQVMSWRDVMTQVAKGDDPDAVADNTAQMNLLSESHAASRRTAILEQFKAALGNGDIAVADEVFGAIKTGATSLDGVTDAEIVTYLQTDDVARRTLLRNVLAQSLSDEEKAVLRAVATDTGLDAALDDEDADFSEAYKMAVKDLLKHHNVGDIRVAMDGGSIDSRGDGIRAYYATPHANNGAIEVTIAAGATVTGANAGVYVANAGLNEGESGTADDILKQTVTVNGMVTGGTDAAVHLAGGGRLTVGETGVLIAGRGRPAILVNEPGRAVIVIHGEVTGGSGARAAVDMTTGGGKVTLGTNGRIKTGGADNALWSDGVTEIVYEITSTTTTYQDDIMEKVDGAYRGAGIPDKITVAFVDEDGNRTGPTRDEPIVNGSPSPPGPGDEMPSSDDMTGDRDMMPPPSGFNCDGVNRCRLYAALPSALLAMNGLPTYGERVAAARDGNGGWARVDGADGEWKAKNSTQGNMAFDYRRYGVQAGVDLAMDGLGSFGMSVRGLQGSAEMTEAGGEVELSGVGAGVHGTAFLGEGFHVDAQAMATWYDVKVTSGENEKLADDAEGRGFAMGLEIGRRTDMGDGLAVTPAVGLTWSDVSLSFPDGGSDGMDQKVSVEDARSLVGRAGVRVETRTDGGPRLFGSVEVTHEFSDDRTAKISNETLKTTEARKTGVRVGFGGEHGWEDGRYALRGAAGYAARGSGNGEFDGGLSLAIRF